MPLKPLCLVDKKVTKKFRVHTDLYIRFYVHEQMARGKSQTIGGALANLSLQQPFFYIPLFFQSISFL
jgi:hypothetical protein